MSKMIKFKGVLDGFRSTQPPKAEEEVVETLKPDNFQIAKVIVFHNYKFISRLPMIFTVYYPHINYLRV